MKMLKKWAAFLLITAVLMSIFSVCVYAQGSEGASGDQETSSEDIVSDSGIKGVKDLPGKRIGVQLGTTGAVYARDVEKAQIQEFNKGADAVMALTQNKIDCVIIDEQTANAFVSSNKKELSILEERFTDEEYAAVISKSNAELLSSVNKAISELKENGTLDQIIKSYIPEKESDRGKYHYKQVVTQGQSLRMATNAQFPPY